jgi:hypothetical protein
VYSVAASGTFDLANYGDLLFPILLEHELKKRLGPGLGLTSVFTRKPLQPRIAALIEDGLFPSHGRILGLHTGLLALETERSVVDTGLRQLLAGHWPVDLIFAVRCVRRSIGTTTGSPPKSETFKGVE